MAYKKKPPERAGGNEWINTYADVVTLLLTFFVLLFAISSVNEKKFEALVKALNPNWTVSEIGGGGNAASTTTSAIVPINDDFDEIYTKIYNYVKENNLTENITVKKTDDYILLRFTDDVLFSPDKADLNEGGRKVISFISDAILTTEDKINQINIEGHTADSIEGEYSAFSWQLSVSRAVNVLRYMVEEKGLTPSKLSAVGYSKYRPIADNHSAWGRSQNRRVEITITQTKKDADNMQDVVEGIDSTMTGSQSSIADSSASAQASVSSASVSSGAVTSR